MAAIINGNQIKLNSGQVINGQEGGWYDGQQLFGGTLSQAGVINANSNQQGAGQAVSKEVVAQTNPANVAYLQQQNAQAAPAGGGGGGASGFSGGGGGGASVGAGSGMGYASPDIINLPELYKTLYGGSGISDLEGQLSKNTQAYNDAQMKINDNPFLSEANRVGRQQKLATDFDNRTANMKNDIATKKADIEMQLNLQTKQFDINSQAAQQALSQFNSLLQMGALDNASGEDIANITRSTGLSSQAIQSAVNANKAKNVQTAVIQYDDGQNTGFAVVNQQTGEIISKQNVAPSKPAASGSGTLSDSRELALQKAEAPSALAEGARQGKTLASMIEFGTQNGVSAQDIWNIYQSVDYYHMSAAQRKADMKKYGIK